MCRNRDSAPDTELNRFFGMSIRKERLPSQPDRKLPNQSVHPEHRFFGGCQTKLISRGHSQAPLLKLAHLLEDVNKVGLFLGLGLLLGTCTISGRGQESSKAAEARTRKCTDKHEENHHLR